MIILHQGKPGHWRGECERCYCCVGDVDLAECSQQRVDTGLGWRDFWAIPCPNCTHPIYLYWEPKPKTTATGSPTLRDPGARR